MSPNRVELDYPAVMAAIGKFVAHKGISNVCVLEFEHGIIVTGSVMYDSGENLNRRTETHVFSIDDLKKMSKGG